MSSLSISSHQSLGYSSSPVTDGQHHPVSIAYLKIHQQEEVALYLNPQNYLVCDHTKNGLIKKNIKIFTFGDRLATPLCADDFTYYTKISAFVVSHLPWKNESLIPYEYGQHYPIKVKDSQSILTIVPSLNPSALLERKLRDTAFYLKPEESIAVLREGLERGEKEAVKAVDQELVVFIGNTGAGKSTFINYLYGCTMQKVSAKELGVQAMSSKVVTVKPKASGGALDEVMPIGHTSQSMTFMPHIETDRQGLTYCDCPGFLDNRGFEINIANAVNIKNTFSKAKSLKVILLVNYHSLKADHARGLIEMIKISCGLFGTMERLIDYKDSILLGVTQIPLARPDDDERTLEELKQWIASAHLQDECTNQTLRYLAERLFIYDPLDANGLEFSGTWKRPEILERIAKLKPILSPSNIFKIVLTAEDEQGVRNICDALEAKIRAIFKNPQLVESDFRALAYYQKVLTQLEVVEHSYIVQLIDNATSAIITYFRKMIWDFDRACVEDDSEDFESIQGLLKKIKDEVGYFDRTTREKVNQFLEDTLTPAKKNLSFSSQLMRNYSLRNYQLTQRMQDFILAANKEIKKLGYRLSQNLQEFSNQSSTLSQSLKTLVSQIEKELGQPLAPARLSQVWSLFGLAQVLIEMIKASSFHYLQLEEKANFIGLKQWQGAVELALYARKMEIEYMKNQLEVLQKQEDHELEICLKIHAHKLKEETQKFDQFLQLESLQRQERENKMQRDLASLQQGLEEIKRRDELLVKEQEIYRRHQEKMRFLRIQGEKDMYWMDVEARCRIVELLSSVN